MHPVLPFPAVAGGSDQVSIDLQSGRIRPSNPRTVGLLLANTWVAGRLADLRSSVLADSILVARHVEGSRSSALARILGALHLSGKVFGGDVHKDVPTPVRNAIDGYHSACRSTLLRDLGLFDPPPSLLLPLLRAASLVASGALDGERKLLPGRVDRLVSLYTSLFRVGRDQELLYANPTNFADDSSRSTCTVDLRPLYREGRAVVVPMVRR